MKSVRGAALAASGGFVLVAGFQFLLALGVPLGRAAWGGRQSTLSTELRIGSAISTAVFLVAALVVLGGAGYFAERSFRWFRRGTWFLAGAMGVGALMNVASSSPWERFLWAPMALTLAVLCFVVARGGSPQSDGMARV